VAATPVLRTTIRPGDDWVFPVTFATEAGDPIDVSGWTFPEPELLRYELDEQPPVATAAVNMGSSATGVVLYTIPAR
jgi:hypothetical protein